MHKNKALLPGELSIYRVFKDCRFIGTDFAPGFGGKFSRTWCVLRALLEDYGDAADDSP